MNIILFDDDRYIDFLPLTYTRPIGMLRCGIFTIAGKWEKMLDARVSFFTKPYLSLLFPTLSETDNYWINARFLPTGNFLERIKEMQPGETLWKEQTLAAARMESFEIPENEKIPEILENLSNRKSDYNDPGHLELQSVWDVFRLNDRALRIDFEWLLKNRVSKKIPENVNVLGNEVFIDEGAEITFATINSMTGPVYIGKDAVVMEGAAIRGPFALLEYSQVKMGAKIYGATTVGPHSKVGGELNNVVIQGYSNKNHDGFLGNAVIGEWCNLGADTNNSNLKNNYATVKTWSYRKSGFADTGLQFCGLAMGDHSKTGINTMFNTGTVVGVGCNIFGAGYPRTFIPSFSWGGAGGRMVHKLKKFFETAGIAMQRRGVELSEKEKVILSYIFEETEKYRT